MQVVTTVLVALQMLSALVMIGLILVQHGKGADMGAAFGSGSSGSLFGASGSANFMSRATAVLAAVFFVCTLALAYFRSSPHELRLWLGAGKSGYFSSCGRGLWLGTYPYWRHHASGSSCGTQRCGVWRGQQRSVSSYRHCAHSYKVALFRCGKAMPQGANLAFSG
jgi:protein translocase SecG subunit